MVFIYALKSLDRGVVPRHEIAWLLKIAENVCRTSRRSLGRRRAVMRPADVGELEAVASSVGIEAEEELVELRDALQHLPETQRRAILLREWHGLSYADIADELQLSVSAVETLLFRARRGLAVYREKTRSVLGALNLGPLLFNLRSALQSGLATTATAGVVIVVASPVLVGGDGSTHARPFHRPATPVHAQAVAAAGPAPAQRATRDRRSVAARRAGTRTARGGKHRGPSSGGRLATAPPSVSRQQSRQAPSPGAPGTAQVTGTVNQTVGRVAPPVVPPVPPLPPLPALPPVPPLPPVPALPPPPVQLP